MGKTPDGMTSLLVFMSDGGCGDGSSATSTCRRIASAHRWNLSGHRVGFGSGCNAAMLTTMSDCLGGKYHSAADAHGLHEAFIDIATDCNVAEQLTTETGKRICDSVCDKFQVEYMQS